MKPRILRAFAFAALACAGACSANPARASMAVPLQIPEPPPRAAIDPVQAAEPPAEAVPVTASRPTVAIPPPSTPRGAAPSAPAPPPVPAPQAAEPLLRAVPPPELRPADPSGRSTSAQVRESLGRTKVKLDAIDRRLLNAGKRSDYDAAVRFLAQAEAAVQANNLLLAESSVEKAETLADGLR